MPVYLTEVPNINDFSLFANGGGWDGNWYVGYNTCWISKLPVPPAGDYTRAFLGAKLGRMKTESVPGRPSWEKQSVDGEIQIAVAPEPLWPQSRRFLLTPSRDIPMEGDSENAVEKVGESRWFWVEVPLKYVSLSTDNYVALFSPSESLSDARRAPTLAAAWGDTRQNTWLNSGVKGEPPANAVEALKTGVTYFEPAIAIKLIPRNSRQIQITAQAKTDDQWKDRIFVEASVAGQDIQEAWVEFSTDTKNWHPISQRIYGAPYAFSVKAADVPAPKAGLRVGVRDIMENRAYSEILRVELGAVNPAKK